MSHSTQDACVKHKSHVSRAILTRHATRSNQEWFYGVLRENRMEILDMVSKVFPNAVTSLQSVKMLLFYKFLLNSIVSTVKKKESDLPTTMRTSQTCIQFEDGRMDRGVYVRFSGEKRVFYRFSFSPIFKVIWINGTTNTGIQGLMKKYVICLNPLNAAPRISMSLCRGPRVYSGAECVFLIFLSVKKVVRQS